MTSLALQSRPRPSASPADWLIPVALLALAFIPVVAGGFRLTTLATHAEVTSENLRFFASPVPVVLHIVSVTIYSVFGAFQFSPGVRRRWPIWHRAAGRVLVVAGLVAALSGLWMAMFYAIVPADPPLLHMFRLTFGAAMALSIVLGFIAIRQRKIGEHQAWMRRAYAIGMGAGTQGLIQIPYITIFGQPDSFTHALLMGCAWALNLGIRRMAQPPAAVAVVSAGLDLGRGGVLASGKWLPVRSIGWSIGLVFSVMLAFGPTMEAVAQALPNVPSFEFLAKALGALIVLVAYTLLVRVGEHRWPAELDLRVAPLATVTGLVVGVLMFSCVMLTLVGTGTFTFTLLGPAPAWHAAGLAIELSVLEEVLVRGVVLRLMWRAFGPVVAFGASALLFGLGHIGNPGANLFTTACVTLEAGIMLGAFYALTGRLWVSIGVHAGWNFAQGYLFGARVSGGDFGDAIAVSLARPGSPDWMTGGTFGPEASLASLAICTAVGAVVLFLAWRSGRFVQV